MFRWNLLSDEDSEGLESSLPFPATCSFACGLNSIRRLVIFWCMFLSVDDSDGLESPLRGGVKDRFGGALYAVRRLTRVSFKVLAEVDFAKLLFQSPLSS